MHTHKPSSSRPASGKPRAVLLDRDGTIAVEKHYVSDPNELELIPGAGDAIRRLGEHGLLVAVVTNQSAIGRGYFDAMRLEQIHARLLELLAAEGAVVHGVYVCPHAPNEGCDCRKPNTGLLRKAASELSFDLSNAFMVGDKAADIEAGRRSGATTILVKTGYGEATILQDNVRPDFVVSDISKAASLIQRLVTHPSADGSRRTR